MKFPYKSALALVLSVVSSSALLGEDRTRYVSPTAPGQELSAVEGLIASTRERLERLEALKVRIVELDALKAQFARGEQTRAQTAHIVAAAQEIGCLMQQEQVGYLFSEEYREQLAFLLSFLERKAAKPPEGGGLGLGKP